MAKIKGKQQTKECTSKRQYPCREKVIVDNFLNSIKDRTQTKELMIRMSCISFWYQSDAKNVVNSHKNILSW